MARYKDIHYDQDKLIPISFQKQIVPLFRNVLLICNELKLIGGDMFAIDGCKLPCNASKSWSGTKAELQNKKKKLEKAARAMLKHHRDADARPEAEQTQREAQAAKSTKAKARKIQRWLNDNDDKPGKGKTPRKSNITDNESAKMKTSKGVIQGYDGVACLDKSPGSTPRRTFIMTKPTETRYLDLMKKKIDTREGRYQYCRRMGIVDPYSETCAVRRD